MKDLSKKPIEKLIKELGDLDIYIEHLELLINSGKYKNESLNELYRELNKTDRLDREYQYEIMSRWPSNSKNKSKVKKNERSNK